MKTREEVVALFRSKYDSLKSGYPQVGPFDENALYQLPDGGWQIDLENWAAITLRPGYDEPHETHGSICARWYREGGAFDETGKAGWLGHPVSDEEVYEDDGNPADRISHFENGDIVWLESTPSETNIQNIMGDTVNEIPADEQTTQPDAQQPPPITWALPESAKRLKNFIGEKLDEIDRIASGMLPAEGEIHEDWKTAAEKARIIREKLQPYLDAFGSQAFFIVTFGMLKAGKSTLVNALVGKPDVSPVGHGRETTKRSSIIFSADDEHPEGVYIYTPKGRAQKGEDVTEWRRKKCEALILALGGVGKVEDEFDVEGPKRLSGKEMDELLTSKPDEEELPPVLRIQPGGAARFPGENLLKDGVAILDTPGLDGIDVNATNDAFWQVLPAQGDFFLLVQSSMSGLNDDCATQIAKIYGMTENKPGILIVYNEIASQFWLDDEVQKRKLKKDQQEVQTYLRGKLREVSQGAATDIVSVNAGAASAALFGNEEEFSGKFAKTPDELLKQSCIGELTAKLRRMLRTQRTEIKINRLKGLMGKDLEEIEKCIGRLLESLPTLKQEDFSKAEEKRHQVNEQVIKLQAAFRDTATASEIVSEIVRSAATTLKPMQESIDDALKENRPAFTNDWEYREKCCEAITKAVDQVNTVFSQTLANSIVSGTAILRVFPWNSFRLPEALESAVGDIYLYLGNGRGNATEEFRCNLLSGMQPQDIINSIGYTIKDADTDFAKPGWFVKHFHKNQVSKKTWDEHVPNVKSRIKRHFGLAKGRQGSTAADHLKDYVQKCIFDQGRKESDKLAGRVAQQAGTEDERETRWKSQNDSVIAALERIRALAGEIHNELRKG